MVKFDPIGRSLIYLGRVFVLFPIDYEVVIDVSSSPCAFLNFIALLTISARAYGASVAQVWEGPFLDTNKSAPVPP